MEMISDVSVGKVSIGIIADVWSLLGYGGSLDAELSITS